MSTPTGASSPNPTHHNHHDPGDTPEHMGVLELLITGLAIILSGWFIKKSFAISEHAGMGSIVLCIVYFGYVCFFRNKIEANSVATVNFGGQPIRKVSSGFAFVLFPLFHVEIFPYREITILLAKGAGEKHGPQIWGMEMREPGIRFNGSLKRGKKKVVEGNKEGLFLMPQVAIVASIADLGRLQKTTGGVHEAVTQLLTFVLRFLEGISEKCDALTFDDNLRFYNNMLHKLMQPDMHRMGFDHFVIQIIAGLPGEMIRVMANRAITPIRIDVEQLETQRRKIAAEGLRAERETEEAAKAADEERRLQANAYAFNSMVEAAKAAGANPNEAVRQAAKALQAAAWSNASVPMNSFGGAIVDNTQKGGSTAKGGK